jgi:hypothetical protein
LRLQSRLVSLPRGSRRVRPRQSTRLPMRRPASKRPSPRLNGIATRHAFKPPASKSTSCKPLRVPIGPFGDLQGAHHHALHRCDVVARKGEAHLFASLEIVEEAGRQDQLDHLLAPYFAVTIPRRSNWFRDWRLQSRNVVVASDCSGAELSLRAPIKGQSLQCRSAMTVAKWRVGAQE